MTSIIGLTLQAKAAGKDVDVELDPTSSKFGDIRVGNNTYNIGGGTDWVITLFAKMFFDSGKNQYGVTQEYGTGFGQQSRLSSVMSTLRYKASPNAAILIDFLAGQNAIGKKFMAGADRETLKKAFEGDQGAASLLKTGAEREAFNRLVPIYWQTLAPDVIAAGYDISKQLENIKKYGVGLIGIGINDAYFSTDWIDKDGKQIKQFKEKYGIEKTNEASDKYNTKVNEKVSSLKKTEKFKNLSNGDKQSEVEKVKDTSLKEVFKEYNFTYKK
jgi:hypothetical protein